MWWLGIMRQMQSKISECPWHQQPQDQRVVVPWYSSCHYCTMFGQVLHRFRPCPCLVEDLQSWESLTMIWLEIRLNAFCRSTITQKKIFLIIIIISHQTLQGGGLPSARLFTTKHDRLVNCSGKPLKGTLKRLFYQVLLWGHVRNENWYIFSSLDLWPIKLENWF